MSTNRLTSARSRWYGIGVQPTIILVITLLIAGCGNGIAQNLSPTPEPSPTSVPTTVPTVGPTATPDRLVTGTDAEKAVVRINVRGSYSLYEKNSTGTRQEGFSGSGFIIDPSGLVVTNNHVVAGSTTREVYIQGEDKPRRAEVIGVAECADLALLDIEGDGFPYFKWFNGDVKVGTEVYAAGFPLNDKQYTLTNGIISKASANGDSQWASVQKVIEHTATLNPGSSGGPLYNKDGKVVGVNYASKSDAKQYFAISAAETQKIIADIKSKQVRPQPIGLRVQAFTVDNASAVWVEGVTAGSVADKAGLKPGDIIMKMGGLNLAEDGTLANYCSILSDRGLNGTLNIKVLRPGQSDTEVWKEFEGQIDGKELAVIGTYVPSYPVANKTKTLQLEIPKTWTYVAGDPMQWNGQEIPSLIATTNRSGFMDSFHAPGVQFVQFPIQNANPAEVLGKFDYSSSCTYQGREDYQGKWYTGVAATWANCGGTNTQIIMLAFVPSNRSYLGFIKIQLVGENDAEIRHIIEESIQVNEQ